MSSSRRPSKPGTASLIRTLASERAVGRVDDRRGGHQQERPAERVGDRRAPASTAIKPAATSPRAV